MSYLREFGQIDARYWDDKVLLEHALLIIRTSTCFDANIQSLGTGAGTWIGIIRYYCNGVLFELEEEKQKIKQRGKKNGK